MKLKGFFEIAIRILILGLLGFFMTFATENLHYFFGDTLHDCKLKEICSHNGFGKPIWNWGSRHYWYSNTLFILFIWALISFVMRINILVKNKKL